MPPPFPGPRWTSDQIAEGLVRHGFTGWSVRSMGAIVMAESAGFVWAHALNTHDPESVAYLSEDHGLCQINDYWVPQVWGWDIDSPASDLMAPYWAVDVKSFSQLAKDPEWNLAMARQVFLLRALTHGYANAYSAWSSWNNGRHMPYMGEALAAARRAGAIG